VISIEAAYEALRDRFSFDIREIFEDHAFSEFIRDDYIVRGPITKREPSNKIYRNIAPDPFWDW
jgi:hypothetical protein